VVYASQNSTLTIDIFAANVDVFSTVLFSVWVGSGRVTLLPGRVPKFGPACNSGNTHANVNTVEDYKQAKQEIHLIN